MSLWPAAALLLCTCSRTTTKRRAVVAPVGVGAIPMDVSISPDGARAYATNVDAKSVSVIDTASNTVVANVGVEFIPVHVSISPDGCTLT
jgi:YVTN family beta-propeller protein